MTNDFWKFYMETHVRITDDHNRTYLLQASDSLSGQWSFPAEEIFVMTAANPWSSDQFTPQMNSALNAGLRQGLERAGANAVYRMSPGAFTCVGVLLENRETRALQIS
ncbi:MAG: hypothetical protein NT174_06190 [Actinobacteria bacterium]|nr:hypothetical protein [Actinomycetota bacterium]